MFACCDESGIHKKSRWWVIGALWLPDDSLLPQFEADATALRQETRCFGEFKWEKVNARWIETYLRFLDLALALPDRRFTSIVIDTRLFTPEEMEQYHGDGGRPRAYLKFMRLLLRHRIDRWVEQGHRSFTLLYDKLGVERDLQTEFREVLTGDMPKIGLTRTGSGLSIVLTHLGPVNSASLHFMQAADLITGATRYRWEGRDDTSAKREAREAICDKIETWAGDSLTHEGFWSDRYYSLWRWKPTGADETAPEVHAA